MLYRTDTAIMSYVGSSWTGEKWLEAGAFCMGGLKHRQGVKESGRPLWKMKRESQNCLET